MFFGAWLHTSFQEFVRRYDKNKDGWTHWKIALTRERYSDCATHYVECRVYRAKKSRDGWTVEEKPTVERKVYLGNTNFDADRMRTPHEEKGENDPKVIAELRTAFHGIKRHIDGAVRHELSGFNLGEIDVCIILACLKSEECQQAAAA